MLRPTGKVVDQNKTPLALCQQKMKAKKDDEDEKQITLIERLVFDN